MLPGQQTVPSAWQQEVGGRVPLGFRSLIHRLLNGSRRRVPRLDCDTFKGPANDPSEQPMCGSNDQENPILSPGKVVTQNVDERNCSANNSHIEPPDNPAVDPQVDVHIPS